MLFLWLLLLLSACAPMARLSMETLADTGRYCEMTLRIENLKNYQQQPVVEFLVFDSGGNTLTKETVRFDPIMPGKSQEKRTYVRASCKQMARVHVTDAYLPELYCSGGWCARNLLVGVNDREYVKSSTG